MTIKQQGGVFGRNPTFNDITVDGELAVPDDVRIKIGDGDDLVIYHNSSNNSSYIAETGSGNLLINGSSISFNNGAFTKTYMLATDGGSVQLRYNDDTKIETANTGVSITGNVIVNSGNGIDFSATAGTGTSELLDDYEEGTWTPALLFGGASTGITYSHQTGVYTKIGNIVNFSLRIRISSAGSATGAATISGLPFAPTSPNGYTTRGYLAETNSITAVMPNGAIIDLQQVITLYDGNGNARAALDNTAFTTNSYLTIVGAYQA
jgi:hypothetical protein